MPSDVVPRRRLTTWDKVSLYTLDSLPRHRSWYSTAAIKDKARLLIMTNNIANVSSNLGAAGMVSSCLNKLAVLGIVTKDRVSIRGRRRTAYRLNRNADAVARLIQAIDDELRSYGSLNSNYWQTSVAYNAIYSIWHAVTAAPRRSTPPPPPPSRNNTLDGIARDINAARAWVSNASVSTAVPVAVAPNAPTNDLNIIYMEKRQQALRELELLA